jgi:hypothetical protein
MEGRLPSMGRRSSYGNECRFMHSRMEERLEPGISEFTFGYSFLYEQTRASWSSLCSAPILPSLTDEQSKGWDANLPTVGADYYYQFKLSDYLRRSNASCMRDGHFTGPYYRFWLHRRDRNSQHRHLRVLSQTKPDTYYVAPEFTTKSMFDQAFLSGAILNHSRLIPLVACQDHNDDNSHYMAFQPGNRQWAEHSEGISHESSYLGGELEQVYRSSEARWRPITRNYALHMPFKWCKTLRKLRERFSTPFRTMGQVYCAPRML